MKKLILLGLILITSLTSSLSGAQAITVVSEKICEQLSNLAKTSMTARQYGTPLEKILKGTKGEDNIIIVKKAYEHPIALDDKDKIEYINKYVDEVASECHVY